MPNAETNHANCIHAQTRPVIAATNEPTASTGAAGGYVKSQEIPGNSEGSDEDQVEPKLWRGRRATSFVRTAAGHRNEAVGASRCDRSGRVRQGLLIHLGAGFHG